MNLLDNPENSVEIYQVLIEVHTVFRKIIFAQVGTLIRGLHHVVLALDPRTLHLRFKAVLCCFSFDSSLPCLMHGLKAGRRRIDMHSLPWGDPSRRLRRAGSEGPLSNVRSRSFLPKALERGTQGERSRLGYAALQLGSGRVLVLCRCRSGPTSATVASGPRPAESVGRLVYAGQGGSPSWMPWRSALSPGRLPVRCLLSRARGAIRPHASHGAARAGGGDAVHGVGARPGRRRQPGTHARTHGLGGFSERWAARPSRKGGGRRVPASSRAANSRAARRASRVYTEAPAAPARGAPKTPTAPAPSGESGRPWRMKATRSCAADGVSKHGVQMLLKIFLAVSVKCCHCDVSYRNKTVKRPANTRGTLFLITFSNRWTGFCGLDFFSNARFQMRELFFFGTDPCEKRKIEKAEPVAQNTYAASA